MYKLNQPYCRSTVDLKQIHKLIRWPPNRRPPDQRDLESTLVDEGWSPYRMVDPPCTYYHTKCRPKDEIRWVVRGQILVGLEDQQIVLGSGDRLELPAGMPHWVRVLSEDGAIYLVASRE
jgi:uncharacterized protein YjlB